MSDQRPLNRAELAALAYLKTVGPDGVPASDVGAVVWRDRKRGAVISSNGGGDYAAQMLLGRLRARGLARVCNYDGSSRWVAT